MNHPSLKMQWQHIFVTCFQRTHPVQRFFFFFCTIIAENAPGSSLSTSWFYPRLHPKQNIAFDVSRFFFSLFQFCQIPSHVYTGSGLQGVHTLKRRWNKGKTLQELLFNAGLLNCSVEGCNPVLFMQVFKAFKVLKAHCSQTNALKLHGGCETCLIPQLNFTAANSNRRKLDGKNWDTFSCGEAICFL